MTTPLARVRAALEYHPESHGDDPVTVSSSDLRTILAMIPDELAPTVGQVWRAPDSQVSRRTVLVVSDDEPQTVSYWDGDGIGSASTADFRLWAVRYHARPVTP